VGLKPSARECEARLRGLYRIIYSKTILWLTSLQKRTAETPGRREPSKRTMMDAWRSMRVRNSLWNPPLRTLRLSSDLPFLQ
jgi:hypothetical protein